METDHFQQVSSETPLLVPPALTYGSIVNCSNELHNDYLDSVFL